MNPQVRQLIIKFAKKYRLDPDAVLRVARTEGGIRWGAIGDQGTSFGPFQLHVGGALPKGRGAKWANSPAGLEYAIRQMAKSGAKGLKGKKAVEAIVRNFERPADPNASIMKAMGFGAQYTGGQPNAVARQQRNPGQTKLDYAPVRAAQHNLAMAFFNSAAGGDFDISAALALAGAKPIKTKIGGDPKKSKNLMGPPGMRKGKALISGFTMGGGPEAHGSRPLGNWQSDKAWDLMAPAGTAVYAPSDGVVTKVRWSDNGKTVWGTQITLRLPNGEEIFLTHLGPKVRVKAGQKIKKGQLLGRLGNAPYFAPHLHIGIKNGTLEDYL